MEAPTRAGRIVGALIIVQMVGGGLVNFFLEAPLFGSPGFLEAAAPHAKQIAFGALSGVITESFWLAIAVTTFPLFHERGRTLMLWFGALSAVILGLALVEAAAVMSMITASEAYTKATPAAQEQLLTIRAVIAAARNWPHYLARMVDGVAIAVFYAVLYRLAAVPRWIAGFGLIAAPLMI